MSSSPASSRAIFIAVVPIGVMLYPAPARISASQTVPASAARTHSS